LFEEITASSLIIIVRMSKLNDSPSGESCRFVIHSAIHAAREDAGACCTPIPALAWL
jgi:ribulose-5-phosphate 4-epimerase/fuculose-1-phosphate aldolase